MIAFDQEFLATVASSVPDWRRLQMDAAYLVFEELGEPTGAEEDWRYVDFDLAFSELSGVIEPGSGLGEGPFLTSLPERSGHVLIVDGEVVVAESETVSLTTLAEQQNERVFSRVATDHNKLAAAHNAFANDAVFIDIVPDQVMEAPLVVEVHAVTPGSASFPHVSVNVGENAEAQVLIVYRSVKGEALLIVPEVDLTVDAGGRLRFLSLQSVDPAATCVIHQRVTLGRDATGRIGEVGLGGRFGRLDLGIILEGDGSSAETVGLYFGEGDQTLDYRLLVNHVGKSTTSNVFLKGAVEDNAESVFTGLLRIEKDAVRTNTFETNRNLVLSENAKAHSVPNLEILCNDVVCGHGSSVGPLEEDHLYYLQSRGLPRQRAERLLIKGFFQEVVDRLPIAGVEEPISAEVFRRFVAAQEEGRVA